MNGAGILLTQCFRNFIEFVALCARRTLQCSFPFHLCTVLTVIPRQGLMAKLKLNIILPAVWVSEAPCRGFWAVVSLRIELKFTTSH